MADAAGQQGLSPYHAMACNPSTIVDPLGLAPKTEGYAGGASAIKYNTSTKSNTFQNVRCIQVPNYYVEP